MNCKEIAHQRRDVGEMCAFCDVDADALPSAKAFTRVWWHYCQHQTEVV